MLRISFRLKTILGIGLIEGALLMLLIWLGLKLMYEMHEDELMKRAATTATLFATTTKDAVLSSDLASLESFTEEVMKNPGLVYAKVVDKNGSVLAERGDPDALKRPFVADHNLEDIKDADSVFNTAGEIRESGVIYGQVHIGLDITEIYRLLNEAKVKLIGIALLEMSLVALFSFVLGTWLTRQIKGLELGARQIHFGELGHQIEVRGSDEIARTATAFNKMSTRLKQFDDERSQKEEENHQLNQQLEQRVVERTMQLHNVNKQLEHQALHDSLTNLPNRALFHDRLQHTLLNARRTGDPFAVIGVDLDMFKEVNDTLGHHAGDLVLQHVANACRNTLRASDTVARMGGDEFSILLPQVGDVECAHKTAQRVLAAIKEPLQIDELAVEIGASLGIAVYPVHGKEAAVLAKRCDTAMYEAKHKRSGVVTYRPELGDGSSEPMRLKSELRRALREHELVLHFQPKLDMSTNWVNGVEALVRWQHPRLGLIYPDKFIPMVENSDLIKPFTQEVLRLALRQIQEWSKKGFEVPVAINISSANLQDKDFSAMVAAMLTQTGIPSRLIELEVTETAIMSNPIRAMENIRKLANIDVQVSIDDFGTGYSSMACLQKLLVAKIKIDKSFVIDMCNTEKNEVIVRSTIDLAHNLGLTAVAEGVESHEVWNKLHELGCDSAQGYFMSRPLSAEKFMEWITDKKNEQRIEFLLSTSLIKEKDDVR